MYRRAIQTRVLTRFCLDEIFCRGQIDDMLLQYDDVPFGQLYRDQATPVSLTIDPTRVLYK